MSAPDPAFQARIAAVRQSVDLLQVVQRRVPLRRAGREWKACCPFHDESTPSFTVVPAKDFYHCFGCGAHGDAIRFVQEFEHIGFTDALVRLESDLGLGSGAPTKPAANAPVRRESRKQHDDSWVDSTTAGQAAWKGGQRSAGSLVEIYLRSRGIDPAASGILNVVRYHPRCPVRLWRRWENPRDVDCCEAMLVPIVRPDGGPGARRWAQRAVEIVFLAPDGRGKKRFPTYRRGGKDITPPSRKIWGDAGCGCAPIPPADWFAGSADPDRWLDAGWVDRAGELVIGEGLESTHSLMERLSGVRGGCAALSLGNMQGGWLEDRSGAMPLWNLRPDPERQPFLLPDAGAVAIGVDADMKGLKNRLVQERPRTPAVRRDLTGLERTAICEALTVAHWRQAGAGPVRALRPPMGEDFNDEAKRRAA